MHNIIFFLLLTVKLFLVVEVGAVIDLQKLCFLQCIH